MRPFLPNSILGAFVGCIVGILGWTGLPFFGVDLPRAGFYAFVMAAVAGGSFIGSLKGPMMRWSAGMAAAVGSHRFCARLRRSASTRTGFAPGSALGNICDRPVRRHPRGVAWAGYRHCPAPNLLEARAAVARVETAGARARQPVVDGEGGPCRLRCIDSISAVSLRRRGGSGSMILESRRRGIADISAAFDSNLIVASTAVRRRFTSEGFASGKTEIHGRAAAFSYFFFRCA